ncbi:MAG TPA: histidine phosphatase family protein [Egibacteraceae bacterium]|nr:histidine phosphatase family protein [Egibacteraceae bacterium]
MKRVHLLRHAKSSWDDPALADRDRPLAPRGVRDAEAMSDHLRAAGVVPELVLCSSALRTVQTLERISAALPPQARVHVEPGLYGAGSRELLSRLRELPDEVSSVMLIGHNPGIHDLAVGLAAPNAVAQLGWKFPTAALAVLVAPVTRWARLSKHGAQLESFVTPSQLRG